MDTILRRPTTVSPADLTIGAITDDSDALDLGGTYNDRCPYMDTKLRTNSIANVTTRNRQAQMSHSEAPNVLPETYGKEPAP